MLTALVSSAISYFSLNYLIESCCPSLAIFHHDPPTWISNPTTVNMSSRSNNLDIKKRSRSIVHSSGELCHVIVLISYLIGILHRFQTPTHRRALLWQQASVKKRSRSIAHSCGELCHLLITLELTATDLPSTTTSVLHRFQTPQALRCLPIAIT